MALIVVVDFFAGLLLPLHKARDFIEGEEGEDDQGGADGKDIELIGHGEAYRGGCPDRSSCCKAPNPPLVAEDDAGAEKTDSANDLR